ncbi:hypothetical protein [Nocardioides sp. InS609-2]|uniref:hypothetical protein n=1 Tax=Nocardioides sp. InS609-2 TaxID=2760705 RepID=UPI0020BE6422|nr:hypothetical protein [Nocardioides sp. InS609-2]
MLAHSRLVGEALAAALGARGLVIEHVESPATRAPHLSLRRQAAGSGATAGLVVADLDDLGRWRDVLTIVDEALLP